MPMSRSSSVPGSRPVDGLAAQTKGAARSHILAENADSLRGGTAQPWSAAASAALAAAGAHSAAEEKWARSPPSLPPSAQTRASHTAHADPAAGTATTTAAVPAGSLTSTQPQPQRHRTSISQNFSNKSSAINHFEAVSAVPASEARGTAAASCGAAVSPLLSGSRQPFNPPSTVVGARSGDGESLSGALSRHSSRGAAPGETMTAFSTHSHSPQQLPAPQSSQHQAHSSSVHANPSFFSSSLSSRDSPFSTPCDRVLEYPGLQRPATRQAVQDDDDDEYDHAMHGQEEFVRQLCDGHGDADDEVGAAQHDLSRAHALAHTAPQPHRPPNALRISTNTPAGTSPGAADGASLPPSATQPEYAAPSQEGSAAPAATAAARQPPPLSTFRPVGASAMDVIAYPLQQPQLQQLHHLVANDVAAVARSAELEGSGQGRPQSSSLRGAGGGPGSPLQPPQHQQPPPQHVSSSGSPRPAQMWTATAAPATADDAAAFSQHLQLHSSALANSGSQFYAATTGTATGPAATTATAGLGRAGSPLYAPTAASGSGAGTTSPAALSGYYTVASGTPPSVAAPIYMFMQQPGAAGAQAQPPQEATYAQLSSTPPQHLFAVPLPAQAGAPSNNASVSAPGASVPGSPYFLTGAPSAFTGFAPNAGVPTHAHHHVGASPQASVSAHSGPVSMAHSSMAESSPTSSYYVYLQPAQAPPPSQASGAPSFAAGPYVAPLPSFGLAAPCEMHPMAASGNNSVHGGNQSMMSRAAAAAGLPQVLSVETYPGGKPGFASLRGMQSGSTGPAAAAAASTPSADLPRKQVNVHGAMLNVLPYYPYNESAPPVPAAQIVMGGGASANNSMLAQSMGGSCWSGRSATGSNNDGNLDCSGRSADEARSQEAGVQTLTGDFAALASAPVLPIFIQMFPCELRDRVGVLNRVIEATCGRGAGLVQSYETRSETSFIAHVRTGNVWDLIYKLRCRVLMDRFGFWYAADIDQYVRMKEYCEGVRRLPQQTRHFQTDGLPCMPLVVELSRSVDRSLVTENTGPRCFDELVPIAAVDRHRSRLQGPASSHGGYSAAAAAAAAAAGVGMAPNTNGSMGALALSGSGMGVAPGPVFLASVGADGIAMHGGSSMLVTSEGQMVMMPSAMLPGIAAGGSFRTSGAPGQVAFPDAVFSAPHYPQ